MTVSGMGMGSDVMRIAGARAFDGRLCESGGDSPVQVSRAAEQEEEMFDFDRALEDLKKEKRETDDAARKKREDEHAVLHDLYRKVDAFRDKYSIPLDTELTDAGLKISKSGLDGLLVKTSGDNKFDVKRIRAGHVVAGADLDTVALDPEALTKHITRWAVG